MKNILATAALTLAIVFSAAGTTGRWLRQTAISPDGTTIAFTYKGSIYTVPSEGGRASRITAAGESYDTRPFFSPDGSRIAFSSNRNGGTRDVFVIPSHGGTPVRLTTHSGNENVLGWLNDSTVLFSADIMPSTSDLNGPFFLQVYSVATAPGRRPVQLASLQMDALDVNSRGDILFQNHKGYENLLRKHELSSGTPDVYLLSGGRYSPIGRGLHSYRNPVWMGDSAFAFVSDADSVRVLNIYSGTIGDSTLTKLTHFDRHPVRNLTSDASGNILAFSYMGEIYTLHPGEEPRKLEVEIVTDDYDADRVKRFSAYGGDNIAVSPDGKEVAFTIRGDLYVTNVKYETTRRITDTPGQERVSSFGKDGRTLIYDSERDGRWRLHIASLSSDADKNFAYSTGPIEEEVLYESDKAAQQPVVSPDGEKVAFLEDRTTLRILDLDTREVITALDGRYNYSYSDGDITFRWSPDSRWLLIDYIGVGGWNNKDIALVKADGSEPPVDLTESGYDDEDAQWALGGRAITYATGRYGMRSHGSWGNESDVMLMVLDGEAWDRFHRTKEEVELDREAEEADDEEADDDEDEAEAAAPFDLRNRRHRTERLTERSSRMGAHFLNPEGTALFYIGRSTEGSYKLYKHDLQEDETSVVASCSIGEFVPDATGENLFFTSSYGIRKFNLATEDIEDIDFEAPVERRPSLEREYIFEHCLSQVRDKFYDPALHGVDWDSLACEYRALLPGISNPFDFADLLSELLGELNASHTGASAYGSGPAMHTASLGAYFDPAYTGEGLRVLELLPRSPLAATKAGIEPGDVIISIDNKPIGTDTDYFPLLEGRTGRKTMLTVVKADGSMEDVAVKPLYSDVDLQYQRWVENNEALVDSLSEGRIGYVHIEGMDSESFRSIFDRLLGKYRNCDAVIVDTRFNGGGWLHNDVAQLLSGRHYATYSPRGQYVGSEPFSQWTKPSVMLVNEANYSDAYGTPYAYKTLGIGELVGAPVPGTMTAVWWEQQIDPALVFGIPQVTVLDLNGDPLENKQLQPDVEVYNTPAETTSGNDLQIKAAVDRLLQQIDGTPTDVK